MTTVCWYRMLPALHLLFATSCSSPCTAQTDTTGIFHSAYFEYEERIIGTALPGKTLPLIIAFHYSSGTPKESFEDYNQLTPPFRIVVPRGNYRKRNGYSYFPTDYYTRDSLTQYMISRKTADSMAHFVETISEKYKTKPIVTGISQGGDLSFLLAAYYPQLIKASFPFAAVINNQVLKDLKASKRNAIPIFLFHGESDEIVAVGYTREKVGELKNYRTISLNTYPALGHDISPQMKADYSRLIDHLLK